MPRISRYAENQRLNYYGHFGKSHQRPGYSAISDGLSPIKLTVREIKSIRKSLICEMKAIIARAI